VIPVNEVKKQASDEDNDEEFESEEEEDESELDISQELKQFETKGEKLNMSGSEIDKLVSEELDMLASKKA